MTELTVKFVDSGRSARCSPDPRYPRGVTVDMSGGKTPSCTTALPYPAPRVGMMVITCDRCGLRVAVSVAGRADDPRSVKLACLAPIGSAAP